MKLFDAHTHLNYEEFDEAEIENRVASIRASDIAYIVDAGDSIESSRLALKHANAYEFCYAAIGIHPENASSYHLNDLQSIQELARSPRVVAIGEIGLDFHYGKDNMAEQIELFRQQIRIAIDLKLPIMIHSRDADKLTLDILLEENAFTKTRVQMHCFSGSLELGLEYIKHGCMLSLGGTITFKNNKRGLSVATNIPIEYLMTETDAPYLTPEPHRGKPNRSEYVYYVVAKIAELKGLPLEEASAILFDNACKFFDVLEK